jgi:hypothetical protein
MGVAARRQRRSLCVRPQSPTVLVVPDSTCRAIERKPRMKDRQLTSFTRLLHLHIADRPVGNPSKNRSRALVCTGSIPHTVLGFDLAARIPARASRRIAPYHSTRDATGMSSSLDATAHPCLKSQSEPGR